MDVQVCGNRPRQPARSSHSPAIRRSSYDSDHRQRSGPRRTWVTPRCARRSIPLRSVHPFDYKGRLEGLRWRAATAIPSTAPHLCRIVRDRRSRTGIIAAGICVGLVVAGLIEDRPAVRWKRLWATRPPTLMAATSGRQSTSPLRGDLPKVTRRSDRSRVCNRSSNRARTARP